MADLKNLNLDAFSKYIERLGLEARQAFIAKLNDLLQDTLQGAEALRSLPGRSEDLFTKATIVGSRDIALFNGSSKTIRLHRDPEVRIETNAGTWSFEMGSDHASSRDIPAGRYRVLLFVLPLEDVK